MFCENGVSLVKESQSSMITPYNNKQIDEVCKEINADAKKLVKITNNVSIDKTDPMVLINIKLLLERVKRNKRCVHIYLNSRMEKLQKLTWESGNLLNPHILSHMDEKDKKYYEEYNKLVTGYSKKLSLVDMDLTKDYAPPKDLYVEVRALEDLAIKEKGVVRKIEKNQSYLLKRSDIDIYIRKGLFTINE